MVELLSIATATVAGVGVFVAILVCRVLYALTVTPRLKEKVLREQGIQGSPYTNFLYGDRKKMAEMTRDAASQPSSQLHDILPRIDPLLFQMMKQYGKMFNTWLGPFPMITVMEPSLIREMLMNKSGDFRKPEINAFTRLFTAGVSSLNGQKWAMHRRIISPAFHMEKLKGMLPSIVMCIEEMMSKWESALASKDFCELEVNSEFQKMTANIISHVAFGSSYEEGSNVFQLLNEQGKLLSKVYYIAAFPWLRHLPTKINKRMKQINKEVTTTLRHIIQKRIKAMETGSYVKDDLLKLLLDSNLKEQQENKNSPGSGMTLDEVVEECKLFYFAGHETTANLLTWTILMLSMHPEWQEKAREEVFNLLGRERTPNFDDLAHLKTVTMVLQETLRLYPPSSIIRKTGPQGAKLGDKYLPGDALVFIQTAFVHRDGQVWGKDVLEFNPGRFFEGISKASDKDSAPYFPFGWGPRVCIGQNLSMIESRMALSMMLQRFTFELSPSYAHIPYFDVNLHPFHGAQILVRRLQAS